jgi:hypothetical protein
MYDDNLSEFKELCVTVQCDVGRAICFVIAGLFSAAADTVPAINGYRASDTICYVAVFF